MNSKLAIKLADRIFVAETESQSFGGRLSSVSMAQLIDDSLSSIRGAYSPELLNRCPIVSHHNIAECAFCLTAAMKEFISIPGGD